MYIAENPQLTDISALASFTDIQFPVSFINNAALPDLSGLNNLHSASGLIRIEGNDHLTSLTGLENLTNATGGLRIQANPALTSIEALQNLTLTGGLIIGSNASLQSLSGLDNLLTIDGDFLFGGNDLIDSFAGLENLTSCTGDFTIAASFVPNLSGFENLELIGGQFYIFNNTFITYLSGVSNLNSVGSLFISQNENLESLNGLDNLISVGSSIYIVNHNSSLTDISALSGVISSPTVVLITSNESLASLSGLENIDPSSLTNLKITDNEKLSECDIQSVCSYLADSSGSVEIDDNASGCNSPEEVEEHCLTSLKENPTTELPLLSPNPASSFITITTPQGEPIEEVIIYNHLGQKVLSAKPVNNMIDVSNLKSGIYFYRFGSKRLEGEDKTHKTVILKTTLIMKKLFLFAALLIVIHSCVFSQGCLPEGIIFTTQEEIDNFQANYPGCTEIEGDVKINFGLDITNLSGLSPIYSIGDSLCIFLNPFLSSLSGLESLTSIGGSLIIGNDWGGKRRSIPLLLYIIFLILEEE